MSLASIPVMATGWRGRKIATEHAQYSKAGRQAGYDLTVLPSGLENQASLYTPPLGKGSGVSKIGCQLSVSSPFQNQPRSAIISRIAFFHSFLLCTQFLRHYHTRTHTHTHIHAHMHTHKV